MNHLIKNQVTMDFNIDSVTADMLSAIKGTAQGNWDKVKSTTLQFLERDKIRLQALAELHIDGEIPPGRFESRLSDHRLIMEAELNALMVLNKATAQQAANAAIEVLEKAVQVAISR